VGGLVFELNLDCGSRKLYYWMSLGIFWGVVVVVCDELHMIKNRCCPCVCVSKVQTRRTYTVFCWQNMDS